MQWQRKELRPAFQDPAQSAHEGGAATLLTSSTNIEKHADLASLNPHKLRIKFIQAECKLNKKRISHTDLTGQAMAEYPGSSSRQDPPPSSGSEGTVVYSTQLAS